MKNVLLLGGTSYVGNLLNDYLIKCNYNPILIGTKTEKKFIIRTEQNIDFDIFENVDVVFYLSWYFDTTDKLYAKLNIEYLEKVVNHCRLRKINLYFFSTYYASENSSSQYNQTKGACEKIVLNSEYKVVRLGAVIAGKNVGGFYGKIIKFVNIFKILPAILPNKNYFFLTNLEHIKNFVDNLGQDSSIIQVYDNTPKYFVELFDFYDKRYVKLPIPWQPIYVVLWILEKLKIKIGFRSDSVLSIWGNEKK